MSYGSTPTIRGPRPFGWNPGREATGRILNITLDGLAIQGGVEPQMEADGWLWAFNDLIGWWEQAPVKTSTIDAPGGDGSIPLMDQLGARPISIPGFILAEPGIVGALERGLDRLGRIRRGTLVVAERGGLTRESDVRVTDMQKTRKAGIFASVTLSMQADDPLRYGSSSVPLVASTVLVNRGDATAYPMLDLTGPHGALTISDGNVTTSVVATPSGSTRTVDLRHGLVWQGQTRVTGALSGGLVSVPAGGATWAVSGLGAGTARVRRFEAWS